MKLDKFHVQDLHARPIGHGNAIAGRDKRICRVLIDLADATGRQKYRVGCERLHET